MQVKIRNLKRHGEHGWLWHAIFEMEDNPPQTVTYFTARHNGCGLFLENSQGQQQILGFSQFSLSSDKETARRQIKRHFNQGVK